MKNSLLKLKKKCGFDKSNPYNKSIPYKKNGGLDESTRTINQAPTIYFIG
jgi:hypothetical protein